MKKISVLFVTLIMILLLTACGETRGNRQTITNHSNEYAEKNSSDLEVSEDKNSDESTDEKAETENSDETFSEQEKIENSDEQTDVQEETENSDSTTSNETSSKDGIRPEFKEAMDSYEAFFDEYVEFMKKYNSSTDTMSLLNDYMSFMTRYAEAMKGLEEIDESDLSSVEVLYYTEVMTRINAKLIEAAY